MNEHGQDILALLDERESQHEARQDFESLDFPSFCEAYLKVQDKNGDIVPLVLNRAQKHLADTLTTKPRVLVLKARQLGVSTVIQAWHYYQIVQGNTKTSTLCHDDELTSEIRAMADRFHENIPDSYRPNRKYANAKLTSYPDLNSQARIATVGGHATENSTGKKKGRGGSNTDIHGTEVAFWADANGVLSAAMQAGKPRIVLESTPNGMVGWFYERCMEALDGRGVWSLVFYEWWWNDDYQLDYDEYLELVPHATAKPLPFTVDEIQLMDRHGLSKEQIYWRRWKMAELPHAFAQEYPEDVRDCFLASGKSYFRNIEHVFTAPLHVQFIQKRRYVGGLDFAQTDDYTVLIILDAETYEMVDCLRINNAEWQDMRVKVAQMVHKWNAVVIGEANSMGKTNIELLQNGEYSADGVKLYDGIQLTPFTTSPTSKPPLIQGLYHALHEMGLKLQDISELRHELRAFISKQTVNGHWQYMAGGGAHDDMVMSLALAWYGIHNRNELEYVSAPSWWQNPLGDW